MSKAEEKNHQREVLWGAALSGADCCKLKGVFADFRATELIEIVAQKLIEKLSFVTLKRLRNYRIRTASNS